MTTKNELRRQRQAFAWLLVVLPVLLPAVLLLTGNWLIAGGVVSATAGAIKVGRPILFPSEKVNTS